jgi:hypothetical protein
VSVSYNHPRRFTGSWRRRQRRRKSWMATCEACEAKEVPVVLRSGFPQMVQAQLASTSSSQTFHHGSKPRTFCVQFHHSISISAIRSLLGSNASIYLHLWLDFTLLLPFPGSISVLSRSFHFPPHISSLSNSNTFIIPPVISYKNLCDDTLKLEVALYFADIPRAA